MHSELHSADCLEAADLVRGGVHQMLSEDTGAMALLPCALWYR